MAMTHKDGYADNVPTESLAHAATIMGYVVTFVSAVAAVVGVAFVGGLIWSRVLFYEAKVDKLGAESIISKKI
jgi:hypothetical protein